MAQAVEAMLKGYFKYYNPETKSIYLDVQKKYINSLRKQMRKDIKNYPFKEYTKCNTIYITNSKTLPLNVLSLEGNHIIIRCSVSYYEFKDKEGQIINGYKLYAIKARLVESP